MPVTAARSADCHEGLRHFAIDADCQTENVLWRYYSQKCPSAPCLQGFRDAQRHRGKVCPMEGKRRHCVDMTRDEYNKMRGSSVREVLATHGTISFKDVLLFYQEE